MRSLQALRSKAAVVVKRLFGARALGELVSWIG
jgi:hypothetical protein